MNVFSHCSEIIEGGNSIDGDVCGIRATRSKAGRGDLQACLCPGALERLKELGIALVELQCRTDARQDDLAGGSRNVRGIGNALRVKANEDSAKMMEDVRYMAALSERYDLALRKNIS